MKKILFLTTVFAVFNANCAGAGVEAAKAAIATTKSTEAPAQVMSEIASILTALKNEQRELFRLGQKAYPTNVSALAKEEQESLPRRYSEYMSKRPQQTFIEIALNRLEKFLPHYNKEVAQELRQAFPEFEVQRALHTILFKSAGKLTDEQKWNFFDVLIKAGASVNDPDAQATTLEQEAPLHRAIRLRDEKAVAKLLESGARLDVRSGQGAKTPFELAGELAQYWKEALARPRETVDTQYDFFPGAVFRRTVLKSKDPQERARDKEILQASQRIYNVIQQAQEKPAPEGAAAAAASAR